MPVWLSALLSFLGVLVTLFLGLVGWRLQLIGKRRTEVAKEALLAFAQAADAIGAIRSPAGFSGEGEAVREELGQPADSELPGEEYRVALWRMRQHHATFEGLRRIQLLCKYHLGDDAEAAFASLDAALKKIAVAARMGVITARRGEREYRDQAAADAAQAQVARWESAIWEGVGEVDEVATMVERGKRDLEAILTPHLRADAALLPVAATWRAGGTWLASRRKLPAPSTPASSAS